MYHTLALAIMVIMSLRVAYFPWHALIYVLSALSRKEPKKEDSTAAWEIIRHTYDEYPRLLNDVKKPLHIAIGNLTLRAWDAEGENYPFERKISKPGTPQSPQTQWYDQKAKPLPHFIAKLREQRQPRSSNTSLSSAVTPVSQFQPSQQPSSLPQHSSLPYEVQTQSASIPMVQSTSTAFQSGFDALYGSALEPMNIDATDWDQWERLLADSQVQDWSTSLALQAATGLNSVPMQGMNMGRLDRMDEVEELAQRV